MRTFLTLEPDTYSSEQEEQDKLQTLMDTGATLATATGAAGRKSIMVTSLRASVMALRPYCQGTQESED